MSGSSSCRGEHRRSKWRFGRAAEGGIEGEAFPRPSAAAARGGAVVAGNVVPESWTGPVVGLARVPAHAQGTMMYDYFRDSNTGSGLDISPLTTTGPDEIQVSVDGGTGIAHVEVRGNKGNPGVEVDLNIDGTPSSSFTGDCQTPKNVEWHVDGYTLGDSSITITAVETADEETAGAEDVTFAVLKGWSQDVPAGTGTLSAADKCDPT